MLSEQQKELVVRFWRNQRGKVHDLLRQNSTFNNTLQRMAWRVDVVSHAKQLGQLNTPAAIVEMQLASRGEQAVEVLRFEMDKEKLAQVLAEIHAIESKLAAFG